MTLLAIAHKRPEPRRGKSRGFAALAAGVTVFELAKVMGTSVAMIERHYGTLIGGAHAGLVGRLDALAAEIGEAAEKAGVSYAQGRRSQYEGRSRRDGSNRPTDACSKSVVSSSALAP